MSITLEHKVALVTGGNRGIGKAIVESFFNHGAKKVYLAVRHPDSAKELEEKYGDKVVVVKADVTDKYSISELAEQANDVDVVVNSAGVLIPSSPLDEDAESALAMELEVNVFGLVRVAQAFASVLEKNKGALVQLNSIASIKNFADLSTYSASKAASYSITQALRWKWLDKGVSVVSVHPGPIATDMAANAGFTEGAEPTVVSEAIVSALEDGEFHVFPDPMAKQFEETYKSFSDNCVMVDLSK